MDGGSMYMIAVTAWTPGSLSSTIYQVFLANLPPYNGFCDVIPTTGTDLSTKLVSFLTIIHRSCFLYENGIMANNLKIFNFVWTTWLFFRTHLSLRWEVLAYVLYCVGFMTKTTVIQ